MHSGRYAEALPFLFEGVEVHSAGHTHEVAQPMCYLAACQRLGGDPGAALITTAEASAALSAAEKSLGAKKFRQTQQFLDLERGRAHLALRELNEAIAALSAVRSAQQAPWDYPRLAGTRGLAMALRCIGDDAGSGEMLEECMQVAADSQVFDVLRKVAALASGEAIVDIRAGLRVGRSESELLAKWEEFFPDDRSDLQISDRIRLMVY